MKTSPFSFNVRRLNPTIGAVVDGVALGEDLPSETVTQIRLALLRHRVIFFRGQQHLDDAGQLAFARLLGPLTASSAVTKDLGDLEKTIVIDSNQFRPQTNAWHTDTTYVDHPPAFAVLRALSLPALGGDTVWANTVTAYQELPAAFRTFVDQLRATHTNTFDYARGDALAPSDSSDYVDSINTKRFVTDHPVVRVHPETGERSLLLGSLLDRIIGFTARDSAGIVSLLQAHIERQDNTVRWTWAEGDVAIWDNRATQHYAIADYDEHRLMRRVSVAGDVPVGVDGTPSRALSGDSSNYSPIFAPPSLAHLLVSSPA